jgi:hypothetical protein
VTTVRLRYVRRKRGNLFWEPTPAMRAKGFLPKPLGPETVESIAEAGELYKAWLKAARTVERGTTWPPGSLGAYFDRMKLTAKWTKKKPRTREDYDRAWRRLQGLAPKVLTRITVEDCERLSDALEAEHGPHERYRTVKVLRAIYADAIYRLKLIGFPSPAKGFPNPQPKGRGAIWLGAEVVILIATAEREGYAGMALAIRIAWDTLFSPVDVWSMTIGEVRRDQAGPYIERDRTKTGREAFGHLTPETGARLDAYIAALPGEQLPSAQILRQRNGHAYRSKDTFGDDFRAVRKAAFGAGERRQFQDLRRSGNVEADAAGASKSDMAEIMANTMDTSAFLNETYTPPTVAKAREVAALRLAGRWKLAGEMTRRRSDSLS